MVIVKTLEPRTYNYARLLSSALLLGAIVAQVLIAWRLWALTWDDSAITLGFARTFAQTGRIAPTPGSEIVEGYSTTLWMLLMTLIAKVVGTPEGLLLSAKMVTLLVNIANLLLLRKWLQPWLGETTASLVAGSFGCCFMFYETINGMETPLLLFLVLAMLLLRGSESKAARAGYLLLGSALVLARFEALWLLVPFVPVEKDRRARLISSLTWIGVFVVESILRWRYFGFLLPNTITAKHQFPYTVGSHLEQAEQHLAQVGMIVRVSWYFALIALLFLCARWRPGWKIPELAALQTVWARVWQLRFTLFFTCFCVFLTFAIGANWGPPLRSFYPGLPFLLALCLLPLGLRGARTHGTALAAAAVVLCLFCGYKVVRQVQTMRAPDGPFYMPDTTVNDVRHMSDILAAIQKATGQESVLYAGEDMGAVQLYSRGVRVLDLGLLCDTTLAHKGFGVVGSYVFQQRRPDILEVHGMWTGLVDPGRYADFLQNYRPVIVNDTRVFLQRDLLARIHPEDLTPGVFQDGRFAGESSNHVLHGAQDSALNERFQTYVTLHPTSQ